MIEECITKRLFGLAREHSISLPQIYAVYAKEWVLTQLVNCDRSEQISLRRDYRLEMNKDGFYPEPELFLAIADAAIEKDFTKEVLVNLNRCKVPIKLRIQRSQIPQNVFGQKSLQLFTEDTTLKIYTYEPEQELAECLLKCIRYQNLRQDLSCYDDIYQILVCHVISGRNVTARIEKLLAVEHYQPTALSMQELLRLKQSKQMERKWNQYLRTSHRKSPQWEEVMDLIHRFYQGIWNTLLQDQIFLGDWMPEIKRFL